MIDGHGDDRHLFDHEIKYNFSSNIYYKGCPATLIKSIAKQAKQIESYPSPAANELSQAASNKFNLSEEHFLFTNGATEAFYLIAHLFSDKKVAIAAPTFAEYEDACKIHKVAYQLIDKFDFSPLVYDLVFICNPNNPDGSVIEAESLSKLIRNHRKTFFVIDEAYIEFTLKTKSIVSLVKDLENLIVVRSLTKAFAIPGIRLGYIVAQPTIIGQLLTKKMPWSVNAIAIHAGLEIFAHYNQWQFDIKQLIKMTQSFMKEIDTIEWLKAKPSHTNYFLAELKEGKAVDLKKYLLQEHQILIRDATNFNMLNGEVIRLATQSLEANQALINALKNWR